MIIKKENWINPNLIILWAKFLDHLEKSDIIPDRRFIGSFMTRFGESNIMFCLTLILKTVLEYNHGLVS